MKKRLLSIILAFCLIIPISIVLCSCDLRHKHYCNQYGYCGNCGTDTCVTLKKNQTTNKYEGSKTIGRVEDDVFFRFTASGENGIKIKVSSPDASSMTFKTINFYSESSALITSVYEKTELTWNNTLTAGETYYVRINVESAIGKVVITVEELNV